MGRAHSRHPPPPRLRPPRLHSSPVPAATPPPLGTLSPPSNPIPVPTLPLQKCLALLSLGSSRLTPQIFPKVPSQYVQNLTFPFDSSRFFLLFSSDICAFRFASFFHRTLRCLRRVCSGSRDTSPNYLHTKWCKHVTVIQTFQVQCKNYYFVCVYVSLWWMCVYVIVCKERANENGKQIRERL